MGFSRREYWSGWPFPSPGDLPHPGIKPSLCCRQTLQLSSLSYQGSPNLHINIKVNKEKVPANLWFLMPCEVSLIQAPYLLSCRCLFCLAVVVVALVAVCARPKIHPAPSPPSSSLPLPAHPRAQAQSERPDLSFGPEGIQRPEIVTDDLCHTKTDMWLRMLERNCQRQFPTATKDKKCHLFLPAC